MEAFDIYLISKHVNADDHLEFRVGIEFFAVTRERHSLSISLLVQYIYYNPYQLLSHIHTYRFNCFIVYAVAVIFRVVSSFDVVNVSYNSVEISPTSYFTAHSHARFTFRSYAPAV